MKKYFLILITFLLFDFIPVKSSTLGNIKSIKSDRKTIKEFIALKISLSQRISKCFQPPSQLPNNDLRKTGGIGLLDKVGEKLLLSYLDYICLIDQDNILLVMEEWAGINKLDDFTKGKEVFRVNDNITIKKEVAKLKYPFVLNNPNEIYVEKVDRKNKTIVAKNYNRTSPAMFLNFADIEKNYTYDPKSGFEGNKFVVEKLAPGKFKFELTGLTKGQRPYEDYVIYDMPVLAIIGGEQAQLRNQNKGIIFLGCKLGGCLVRQYIDSSSICNFNNLNNRGELICKGQGSYKKDNWTSYLPQVDKNLVSGRVAAYIIEDPRFESLRK